MVPFKPPSLTSICKSLVELHMLALNLGRFSGLDGSRAVKAQIDPTGTGNNFEDATVTTNGDKFSLDFNSQPRKSHIFLTSTYSIILIDFGSGRSSPRWHGC